MKRLGRLASNVLTLLAVILFAGLAIGPHTGAYRTLTVLSGSMTPVIPAGSVVAVVPTDPSELTEGMIITYAIPIEDKRVVTHRVVEVIKGGERPIVQTKGDANDVEDAWIAQLDGGQIWTHRATIPYLGFGISFLRRPALRTATVVATPLIFLLVTLAQIWGGSAARDPQPEQPGRARRPRRPKPAEAWLVSAPVVAGRGRLAGTVMQGGVVALVLAAVISVTLLSARPAIGLFRSTVAAGNSVTTAQLAVPADVQAVCGGNRITVSWAAATDGVSTGYTVWRSVGGGAWQQLAVINDLATTTYVDGSLQRATTHSYAVRATRGSWVSAESAGTASISTGGNSRC